MPLLIVVVLFALWVYCIFDVIATEPSRVRNLPKVVWLLIVLFISVIGSIAWLALGRPLYGGRRPGDTTRRAVRRVRGPEDDPNWNPRPPAEPEGESS